MQKKLKWTKQQAAAIKKSYQHWLRLALGVEKPGEDMFSGDCALCKLCGTLPGGWPPNCDLCPIVLAGHPRCSHGMWCQVYLYRQPESKMAAFLAKLYRMGV